MENRHFGIKLVFPEYPNGQLCTQKLPRVQLPPFLVGPFPSIWGLPVSLQLLPALLTLFMSRGCYPPPNSLQHASFQSPGILGIYRIYLVTSICSVILAHRKAVVIGGILFAVLLATSHKLGSSG